MLTLPMLFLMQGGAPDCATELRLRSMGPVVAAQVRPYSDCLNANLGTEQQIRTACEGSRNQVVQFRGMKRDGLRVTKAIKWLDAMVHERAFCEATLKVES